MAEHNTGQWEALRDSIVDTPELREDYDRTRRSVIRIREMLQQIDSERELAGLTKAALAERIGVDASVVRRLFSAEASNPTLRTVLELADALGMQISFRAPRRRTHFGQSQRAGRPAVRVPREAVPA
jgi:ribosome-binding protein aMBF1 (putative translation factor)